MQCKGLVGQYLPAIIKAVQNMPLDLLCGCCVFNAIIKAVQDMPLDLVCACMNRMECNEYLQKKATLMCGGRTGQVPLDLVRAHAYMHCVECNV
eukprot:1159420-Pelagomonas_calceolata.AAC.9